MTRLDYDALWREVVERARREYGQSSERTSHQFAAQDVADAHGLTGDRLILWTDFWTAKTCRMSNYSGD